MKYIIGYVLKNTSIYRKKSVEANDPDEALDMFLFGFPDNLKPIIYNIEDENGHPCNLKYHTL